MQFEETTLSDCFLIKPTIFEDSRGYFYEKFNRNKFQSATGLQGDFVQDNISKSTYGVVRGLHLQKGEWAQAKLVSCLKGRIFDVVVDLRLNSSTFGKWYGIELSEDNKLQVYIPRGFAHGFAVLSNEAIFSYKCDNYYHAESEGGILWNDSNLDIDWMLERNNVIVSEKDKNLPTFEEFILK